MGVVDGGWAAAGAQVGLLSLMFRLIRDKSLSLLAEEEVAFLRVARVEMVQILFLGA